MPFVDAEEDRVSGPLLDSEEAFFLLEETARVLEVD